MSPPPVLEAESVRVVYRAAGAEVEALRGVSLAVAAGETVALVGESGSGKTTLLKLFNRLVEPCGGTVRVRGEDAASQDPVRLRRQVGYVQQEGGLLPHWTVARNVELVPWLLGWEETRRRARSREALEMVGLPPGDLAGRYPRELSGGQRQRVAIARALAADPDVVLLDEPFGALDAITRGELQEEFLRLRDHLRKTMLLVTHDLEEAFLLGHRVAVMRAGTIHQADAPEALRASPATDYVRALLERASKTKRPPEGGAKR
ncbi:MAG: ATP-binding cassette domain-containing protein [Candidatus Tectomicrobia bacterium]|nr:ATP-binding cassette domain-containing protein [Candidatus Tectomicrobia bacterium]